jgi:hypothetical protein
MAVPNTFATDTTPIPLADLDANFSYYDTAYSIVGTTVTFNGNIGFSGTGNRITGDFSNATPANRVAFQTSTANSNTGLVVLPNGTATTANIILYNNSDPANTSGLQMANLSTESTIRSLITGTGTYLPMTFYTGGSERVRIDTAGNVGIGTSSPGALLDVSSGGGTKAKITSTVDNNADLEFHTNGVLRGLVEGNSVGMLFGTTGALPNIFITNNTERMRIDSSGNLLVGTTSQIRSGFLSVSGVISTNNNINWGPAGNGRIFSDVNWGCIFQADRASPASAEFLWQNAGGTSRMVINTSGNVGIGTSSPAKKLDILDSAATSTTPFANQIFQLRSNGSGADATIQFTDSVTYNSYFGSGGGNFYWNTTGSERMRIDSSGNLLVGGTTQTNAAKVESLFNAVIHVGFVANDTSSTAGAQFFIASNNGSNIGSIQRVGATSAVVYNTTSDQRLKSNITDSNSVLPTLMEVRVRQFDWTEGEVHQDYGFIAQELEATLSGVVTKGKTEEDMWQMDYARLTPHLVKAIQEQQALITALTARITALESI